MPRAKTILQNEYPYNITTQCINKEWFNLSMDFVWSIFSEELYMVNRLYNLEIHSFVLMNNHFHLIASTPNANIDKCMYYFMKSTSYRITRTGNRINQTYAGRYYKTILQSYNYYLNAYKYNYQNPISAKVVRQVEDYKYSTLNGLLGKSKLVIPIIEDQTLFSSVDKTLLWLNKIISADKKEAIRWGLKRQYFTSKKCRKTNKPILRENDIA